MQSPDAAEYCDFCKEPFKRKAKAEPARAPDPLAGLSKEQLIDLPAERLLKSDDSVPRLPAWLRPIAWALLGLLLVAATAALTMLYRGYREASKTLEAPANR